MPQKYKVLPSKKPIAGPRSEAGPRSIPASGSDFDEAKMRQLAARRSSEDWDTLSDKLEESDPIGSAWCQFMFLVRCHMELEAIDEVSAKEAERHSRR